MKKRTAGIPIFNKTLNFSIVFVGVLFIFAVFASFADIKYSEVENGYYSRYDTETGQTTLISGEQYKQETGGNNSVENRGSETGTGEATSETINAQNTNSGELASSNLKRFLDIFDQKAKEIGAKTQSAAISLFWLLAFIQFTWSAIMLSRRREFGFGNFIEMLIREIMFLGFFYFLLANALKLSGWIIHGGFEQLGIEAGGVELDPAKIISQGLTLAWEIICNSGFWDKIGAVLAGMVICLAFAMLAATAAVCLVKGAIVVPAGVILLGLGGSLWTKQYAENYIKTLMAIGMEVFCLQIIVAVTSDFIENLSDISNFADGGNNLAIAGIAVVILMLAQQVPAFASSMITGGTFGGGSSLVGAMAMAGGMMKGAIGGAGKLAAAASTGGASAVGNAVKSIGDAMSKHKGTVDKGKAASGSGGGGLSLAGSTAKTIRSAAGGGSSASAGGSSSVVGGAAGGTAGATGSSGAVAGGGSGGSSASGTSAFAKSSESATAASGGSSVSSSEVSGGGASDVSSVAEAAGGAGVASEASNIADAALGATGGGEAGASDSQGSSDESAEASAAGGSSTQNASASSASGSSGKATTASSSSGAANSGAVAGGGAAQSRQAAKQAYKQDLSKLSKKDQKSVKAAVSADLNKLQNAETTMQQFNALGTRQKAAVISKAIGTAAKSFFGIPPKGYYAEGGGGTSMRSEEISAQILKNMQTMNETQQVMLQSLLQNQNQMSAPDKSVSVADASSGDNAASATGSSDIQNLQNNS